MAVKIVRHPGKIAVIGAATSAGGHGPGAEKAPAALRAAGLIERLRESGFEVTDFGDIPPQIWQPDEDSPRARNARSVVAALNALRPHVELAAKSGALPLVLGGDDTIVLAVCAGLRRYYRHFGLLWLDRDADLNLPATSPSGFLHGMAVAHLTGRGAAELIRFFNEPPLVREPDIALFGIERLDPPERAWLENSPIHRFTSEEIVRRGASALTETALSRLHATSRDFVAHFDVDFLAAEDFAACDFPALGGPRLADARAALEQVFRQPHLLAFNVTEFNPEKDADGAGARALVDLLAGALAARLEVPRSAEAPVAAAASQPEASQTPAETAPATEPASAAVPEPALESAPEPTADAPLAASDEEPVPAAEAAPEAEEPTSTPHA